MIDVARIAGSAFVGIGVAAIKFSDTIQLGSIIFGVAVVAAAALFTIRAKNAEFWQQSYEGAKAAAAEEKLRVDKLQSDLTSATAKVATLESLPNYSGVAHLISTASETARHDRDLLAKDHTAILEALRHLAEQTKSAAEIMNRAIVEQSTTLEDIADTLHQIRSNSAGKEVSDDNRL